MSLLEGPRRRHDGPRRRRAASRAPSASAACCASAASTGSPGAKLLQRLLGLEAKINQYEQGERFIARGRGRRRSGSCSNRVFEAPGEPARSSTRSATRTLWIRRGRCAEGGRQGLTGRWPRSSSSTTSPTSGCSTKLNLERDGHTIVTAANGDEALEAVRDAPPDLIVLDVMMPEVDGWARARAAQERARQADQRRSR